MRPEELKEYLGIVVDMEKNIFMQGQIMDQWEREIARLGKAHQFQEPSRPQEKPLPEKFGVGNNVLPQPVPPLQPEKMKRRKLIFWIITIIITVFVWVEAAGLEDFIFFLVGAPVAGAFYGAVVMGVMRFCDMLTQNGYGEMKKEYQRQRKEYLAAVEAYPAVLEQYQQQQRREEQKCQQEWQQACEKVQQSNQAAMCEYQKKLDAYHSAIAEDIRRVTLENIKKDVLEAELSQMRTQNAESKEVLQKIYGKNIIFPKYRTMVMVCSLYEYVCSGRCDTLEGHEGAYNILEMEIRLDKIVTQLDRVISMLDKIQQSQYMVYSAIQSANHQSAKILESTYQMANQLQALQASNQQMLGDIQANMQKGILAAERQSVSMTQMTRQLSALQASSALTAYQSERTQKELHYMNRINYLSGKNDDVFFNIPPV